LNEFLSFKKFINNEELYECSDPHHFWIPDVNETFNSSLHSFSECLSLELLIPLAVDYYSMIIENEIPDLLDPFFDYA
jgi:hypothetical protein